MTFLLQFSDTEVSEQLRTCGTRIQVQIHNFPFKLSEKGCIVNTAHGCCGQNSIQISWSSLKAANRRGSAIKVL